MAQLDERPEASAGPDATEVSISFAAGATLITLAGEIDLAIQGSLAFVAEEATVRGLPVRVDASRVTFMDSTGLGLLIQLAATERDRGRRLRVEGADRRLLDLLDIAGLRQVLDVTTTA